MSGRFSEGQYVEDEVVELNNRHEPGRRLHYIRTHEVPYCADCMAPLRYALVDGEPAVECCECKRWRGWGKGSHVVKAEEKARFAVPSLWM